MSKPTRVLVDGKQLPGVIDVSIDYGRRSRQAFLVSAENRVIKLGRYADDPKPTVIALSSEFPESEWLKLVPMVGLMVDVEVSP